MKVISIVIIIFGLLGVSYGDSVRDWANPQRPEGAGQGSGTVLP